MKLRLDVKFVSLIKYLVLSEWSVNRKWRGRDQVPRSTENKQNL